MEINWADFLTEPEPVKKELPSLLKRLTFYMVTKWGKSSSYGEDEIKDERHEVETEEEANVVTSLLKKKSPYHAQKTHALLLDLDRQSWLVDSSTPGHSHLYVDVAIPEKKYFQLLDLLAECGVIEYNYAKFSKEKGGTTLRLPGVTKHDVESEGWD